MKAAVMASLCILGEVGWLSLVLEQTNGLPYDTPCRN